MSGIFVFCNANLCVRTNRKYLFTTLGPAVDPVTPDNFRTNKNPSAKGKKNIFGPAVDPIIVVDFNTNTRQQFFQLIRLINQYHGKANL